MQIERIEPGETGAIEWPAIDKDKRSVVTVGNFDGMHRGHQAIIEKTVRLAKKHDCMSIVIMFDNTVCKADKNADKVADKVADKRNAAQNILTDISDRIKIIEKSGADRLYIIKYTFAFSRTTYISFLGQLVGRAGMRTLVLGKDAHMGADRMGDVKAVKRMAEATGVFELEAIEDSGPEFVRIPADFKPEAPEEDGEPKDILSNMNKAEKRAWTKKHNCKKYRAWSSTNVRFLLSRGRIKDANEILGRCHAIRGTVVHGLKRGRELGFPTANLDGIMQYIPVDGVYAGRLIDEGIENEMQNTAHPRVYPAAISIGAKSTFDDYNERSVEAFALCDDWIDLYGHRVSLEFEGFIRPQRRFCNAEELIEALKQNAQYVRENVTV